MTTRKGNIGALMPLALIAFFSVGKALATPIDPAVEYLAISTLTDARLFTLGYEFSTSVALDVNALGYWVDGLSNDHQVGLWTDTGTLLASTTVLSTDPITGHFQYHAISDIVLTPGQYVIGGEFLGNNDPFPWNAMGVTTITGYTWVEDLQTTPGASGLNFPTINVGTYGTNALLLADFSINSSAVPEPATIALTAAGLLLLGLRRRVRHC